MEVNEAQPDTVESRALAMAEAPRDRKGAPLLPAPMEKLREVAHAIAYSAIANPDFQVEKVGAEKAEARSLAVAYQAARWGMDPMAVASQAYVTPVKGGGEKMAYQAQLIAALVHRSPMLTGRLKYEFFGSGAQRYVRVTGKVKGVKQPLEYVSPTIGQIKVKNSPLWFTDPDQQLAYYGARAWARRHMQEALMGVYAVEEMIQEEVTVVDAAERLKGFEEEPEEAQDAEFEEAKPAEPSGGGESVEPDQDGERASGGGESDTPQFSEADNAVIQKAVDALLAETDPDKVGTGFKELAATKEFGRLIAYDQERANAIKRTVAKHKRDQQDAR